jgi:hypothetical protein
VIVILDGGNASHQLAVAAGQEELRGGVLEKGMLLPIQQRFHVEKQRRDPVRVIPINLPGKANELPQVPGIGYRKYFKTIQISSFSTQRNCLIAGPVYNN